MRIRRRIGSGIAVAALTVALGASVTAAGPALPTAGRSVCAEFTDAVGLYPGNDVTLLGVRVGRVTALRPQPDRVRVEMSLDRGVRLPADAGAVTISTSIVTDRRVEFTEPHTGGPVLGDGCVPLDRTRTPLGVSRAMESMDRLTAALVGPAGPDGGTPGAALLGDTLRTADATLAGTGEQYNRLLQQAGRLLDDPAVIDARMRRLIDNLDRLGATFVTHWPDMQTLLDRMRDTIAMIDGVSNGLGHAVVQLNQLMPVMTRMISRFDDRVYAIADKAVPLTHELLSRSGDIRELLSYLPQAGQSLLGLFTRSGAPEPMDLVSWLLGVGRP
ncbi:MCE family protein [Nocardia wallacei]|uniref:MCE family protein n=1 Tax=Nocardia wallacei TaxID=480035 RepID=UPI002453AC30|nr:MCE family protein [Nocardia wallacei]